MVVVHVKTDTEEQEFLYECPSTSTIDNVAGAVTGISHLQSQIQTLNLHLRRRLLLTGGLRESSPDAAVALDRTLSEAEAYASKDQVLYKRSLSPRILQDHLRKIKKEVMAANSKGLCDSDVLRLFSDCEHHEDTQLLGAGKELKKGNKLCDYIGQNEKTKIIIRLRPLHAS